jgi:hypothetical protein
VRTATIATIELVQDAISLSRAIARCQA